MNHHQPAIRRVAHQAVVILVLAFGFGMTTQLGAEEPAAPAAGSELNRELFDSLDNELFEGLEGLAPPRENAPLPRGGEDGIGNGEVPAGEDIGAPGGADPLTRIGEKMQRAGKIIANRETGTGVRHLQQEIVEDLARVISLLEEQQANSSPSPSPSNSAGNPEGNTDGQGSEGAQQAGRPRGEQSTDRLGEAEATAAVVDPQQLMRAAWGQLPERIREQMGSAGVEEFLPKYRRLIEDYYQRLAEEPPLAP